jgi:hypothetical protein
MDTYVYILILLVLYFSPTMQAMRRTHETVAGIFALNLLLGWTAVGWIVALVWALSKPLKPRSQIVIETADLGDVTHGVIWFVSLMLVAVVVTLAWRLLL